MSWEAIDSNNRGSLTAVSSVDGVTIVRLVADPITGRLLTDNSSTGNTFVYNEVVSGSATTFTLAHTPVTGLYAVYANGQRLTPTVDFTLAGAVITTIDSFAAGTVLSDYQY
jgi:hypothetical protein